MLKKIDWKNFIIMWAGLAMATFCVTDWVMVIVHGGQFTIFGLIINLSEAFIASVCYDYLEEIYEKRKK